MIAIVAASCTYAATVLAVARSSCGRTSSIPLCVIKTDSSIFHNATRVKSGSRVQRLRQVLASTCTRGHPIAAAGVAAHLTGLIASNSVYRPVIAS
jgi:hypothetical protein